MTRNKVARRRGNYDTRRNVHGYEDKAIITSDILLGVFGALVMMGVPFVMAVLKQWGWW